MRHFKLTEANTGYPYKELIDLVNSVVKEVDDILGPGLDVDAYRNAIKTELVIRKIHFIEDSKAEISYKGNIISEKKADLVIQNSDHLLAVKISERADIADNAILDMQAFLRFSDCQAGMIINMGKIKPDIELVVV